MSNFSLPKKARLLRRSEFLELSKKGERIYTGYFTAVLLERRAENTRIGITVSRKLGKAVERNRIKRIIREYFRHKKEDISRKIDINIIAVKGLSRLSNKEIAEKLEELFIEIELSGKL